MPLLHLDHVTNRELPWFLPHVLGRMIQGWGAEVLLVKQWEAEPQGTELVLSSSATLTMSLSPWGLSLGAGQDISSSRIHKIPQNSNKCFSSSPLPLPFLIHLLSFSSFSKDHGGSGCWLAWKSPIGKGKGGPLPVLSALFCGSHFTWLPASSISGSLYQKRATVQRSLLYIEAWASTQNSGVQSVTLILCVYLPEFNKVWILKHFILLNKHICT